MILQILLKKSHLFRLDGEQECLMIRTGHRNACKLLDSERRSRSKMIDMSTKQRERLETPSEEQREMSSGVLHRTRKSIGKDGIIGWSRGDIEISYGNDITMMPLRFMESEIIDEGGELIIPHDKMSITIRRTSMDKIEIDIVSLEGQGKISIPPHSLREIECLVDKRIFTEDHTTYKFFWSGRTICVRIGRLEKLFEIVIMMISELYEHKYIRVSIGDKFFYTSILGIIFVDIRIEDFQCMRLRYIFTGNKMFCIG